MTILSRCALLLLLLLASPVPTGAAEHRPDYCADCTRDQRGKIQRSATAKQLFRAQSGFIAGRPGYHIDHIVPLACGGADAPANMQWLLIEEKRIKDKTERHDCIRTLVGNDYSNIWKSMPDDARGGFAFGFLQGLIQVAPSIEHSDERLAVDAKMHYFFAQCAKKLSPNQMQSLIATYISEHPIEAKQHSLGSVAMAAIDPFCMAMPNP